ncbi:MAG TPA: hypothetical protein VI336_03620 [Candidatus Saccharimonadales bacterium]|nr:hypothetical protein [Candidatus Saccharimonadales bacterium]
MKIYIAARAKTRIDEVKKIQEKLTSMGHSIAYDWAVANVNVKKPYRDPANRKHNEATIPKMLKAAAEADIFILIDEPGLRGAYIELGAFLADVLKRPNHRRVYVVGQNSYEREHVFESPECIKFANSIEEVYKDLK